MGHKFGIISICTAYGDLQALIILTVIMQYLMITVDDYDCNYCNQECMVTDYTMNTANICNHDYDY